MSKAASFVGYRSAERRIAARAPLCADELSAETYDGNGNVTGSSGNTYTYNSLGRLTSATVSGVTTNYVYDPDGILVSKTTNGVTTKFLTDGGVLNGYPQVLAEVVNGSVVRSYAYGLNRVSMTDPVANKTYYFGTDGQGSTRVLMDESGAVTDTFDWAADGILLNRTGTTVCPFGFQGEYADADTGLVYLRARWMNPQTGRFMGMDGFEAGIGNVQNMNKYSFVNGDGGINGMDPLGMYSIAEAGAASDVQGVLAHFPTIQWQNQLVGTSSKVVRLSMRAFAPWPTFGHGFGGDNRTFSTVESDSSRIASWIRFEAGTSTVISARAWSSGSSYGDTKLPDTATINYSASSDNSINMDVAGANGFGFGFAPDIDMHLNVKTELVGKQLTTKGSLTGDAFPNVEVFIDINGKRTMLLEFSTAGDRGNGPFEYLPFDNHRPMGDFSKTVTLN